MNKLIKSLLFATLVGALTACSGSGSGSGPDPDPTPAAVEVPKLGIPEQTPSVAKASDTWDASSVPHSGTSLTITPNPANFCLDSTASVEVSWDLAAANPKNPQLWASHNGTEKLWTAFKLPVGTKRTAKWARAGMQFIAIDATSKKVLNVATLEASTCE